MVPDSKGGMPVWVDLIFESAFPKKGGSGTFASCVSTIPLLLEVTTIYHELAGDQRGENTVCISDMRTRPLQRPRVKLSKKVSRSEDHRGRNALAIAARGTPHYQWPVLKPRTSARKD